MKIIVNFNAPNKILNIQPRQNIIAIIKSISVKLQYSVTRKGKTCIIERVNTIQYTRTHFRFTEYTTIKYSLPSLYIVEARVRKP